jgi:tetratricopeptide (TPR) repeat protein
MSESQLSHILFEAEHALQERRLADAERLFAQALTAGADPTATDLKLRIVRDLQAVEQNVCDLIAAADADFNQGRYDAALEKYADALRQAGYNGILAYHGEIDRKSTITRDLAIWLRRVRELRERIEHASRQADAQVWDRLHQEVGLLLGELPDGERYQPMAEQLRTLRQSISGHLDAQDLYHQAVDAFNNQEYQRAIDLAEAIGGDTPPADLARRLRARAHELLERSIRPALQQAEQYFASGQWDATLHELEPLRADYGRSAEWQRLWARAALNATQHALEEGRQANAERAFAQATRSFERGRQYLEQLLDIAPQHETGQRLRLEIADLTAISAEEAQALIDWRAGRRDEALVALRTVTQQFNLARQQGRDYPAIAPVAEVMRATIEQEHTQLAEERRRLEEAGRLLEQGRYDEAIAGFRAVSGALNPDYQRQAQLGLSRAEAQAAEFERLIASGQQASSAAEAVEAYQSAYDTWAAGPQVAALLEGALVRAGEQALADDSDEAALNYFARALALNPDNPIARAGARQPEVNMRARAQLRQARDDQQALLAQAEIRAEDFDPLLERLTETLTEPNITPGLRQAVEQALQDLRSDRARWVEFARIQTGALSARAVADWSVAVRELAAALTALGTQVPAALQQRLERWRRAQQAQEQVLRDGGGLLQEIEQSYAHAAEHGTASAAVAPLRRLTTLLSAAEQATQAANGPLPQRIADLRQRADALQQRIGLLDEIAAAATLRESHAKLRGALRQMNGDAVLHAIEQRLVGQMREQELPRLVQQALAAERVGDLSEALEALKQVIEIQPDHPDASRLAAELRQRQKLSERLREVDTNAQGKFRTNSLQAATDALLRGLNTLLEFGDLLPPDAREALSTLVEFNIDFFNEDQSWQEVTVLLNRLRQAGQQNWTAGQALRLAERWATAQRDCARLADIKSTAALGALVEAYGKAREFYRLHSDDQEAEQLLATIAGQARTQLANSANKRIERAEEALHGGVFQIALENLASIETEIYAPNRQRAPELIENDEQLQAASSKAERLIVEARQQEQLAQQAAPLLDQVQQAFLAGQLDDATQLLQTLPDLRTLPALAARAAEYERSITRTRTRQAQRTLSECMVEARMALQLATTTEQFDEVIAKLRVLQQAVDWRALLPEDEQNFFQLLAQLIEQREALAAGAAWREQAEAASASGNFTTAVNALEKLLKVTRDGRERARIQIQFDEQRERAAQQRTQQDAIRQATALVAQRDYIQARQELLRARGLGVEVDGLLRTVRAGSLLVGAQQAWDEKRDWQQAQSLLTEALAATAGVAEADELAEEIRRFQPRLKQEYDDWIRIQNELTDANQALSRQDLDAADTHVRTILSIMPEHRAARALQQELGQHREASRLLQQADDARQRGDFARAQALVETILDGVLPDYPRALALQKQIMVGSEANEALLRAGSLAENSQFSQARQALQVARERLADPALLKEAQNQIEQLEQEWEGKTINPIRSLLIDEQFAEALQLCGQALPRAASPELQQKLEQLQAEVLARWVERALQQAQQRLAVAVDEAAFQEIAADLERLLKQSPLPSEPHSQHLQRMLRQTQIGRLTFQFGQAERLHSEGSLQAALSQVQTVVEEARAMNVFTLLEQSSKLEFELEEAIRLSVIRGDEEKIQQVLDQTRTLFDKATERRSLEQAADLLRQLTTLLPRAKQNLELLKLQQEIDREIELFIRTEETLISSTTALRQRRFDAAFQAFQGLSTVSPRLREAYSRQRQIASALHQADQALKQQDWQGAMAFFREALQHDPDVQPLIDGDMERCRLRLTEALIAQVRDQLRRTSPDPARARALLDEARGQGWLTASAGLAVARLDKAIQRQELLMHAVSLLNQSDSDPAQALTMLREARQLPADVADDQPLEQWETLACALVAWQQRELDTTEQLLDTLQAPVANTPRVAVVRAAIQQEREASREQRLATMIKDIEAALRADKLSSVEQALDQAERFAGSADIRLERLRQSLRQRQNVLAQVEGWIGEARERASAGEWAAAVDRLAQALSVAPAYRAVLDVVADVQSQLLTSARAHSDQERLVQAIQLCDLGLRLGENTELTALRRATVAQRSALLAQLQNEALAALNNWNLDGARARLDRMQLIAPGDAGMLRLEERWSVLDQQRDQLRQLMEDGWQAFEQAHYSGALAAFTQTLALEPSFAEAQVWRRYLQELTKAINAVGQEEFAQAAMLLDAAVTTLKLRRDAILPTVFGEIDRLIDRRRQAGFHATQLGQLAIRMDTLDQSSKQSLNRHQSSQAQVQLRQLIEEKQTFANRQRLIAAPPATFQIWLAENEELAPASDVARLPDEPVSHVFAPPERPAQRAIAPTAPADTREQQPSPAADEPTRSPVAESIASVDSPLADARSPEPADPVATQNTASTETAQTTVIALPAQPQHDDRPAMPAAAAVEPALLQPPALAEPAPAASPEPASRQPAPSDRGDRTVPSISDERRDAAPLPVASPKPASRQPAPSDRGDRTVPPMPAPAAPTEQKPPAEEDIPVFDWGAQSRGYSPPSYDDKPKSS